MTGSGGGDGDSTDVALNTGLDCKRPPEDGLVEEVEAEVDDEDDDFPVLEMAGVMIPRPSRPPTPRYAPATGGTV